MIADDRVVVDRLLERHGRTYADELGIRLRRDSAPALFQLLLGSLLMGARIDAGTAVAAGRALFAHGATDAQRTADMPWRERVDALGEGRYVRYDESTATALGETARLLLDRYDGDLDRLRRAAEGDADEIRRGLRGCKGIGRVSADIFCREAQAVWRELRPFADGLALDVAERLGLGRSARELADHYGDEDLSLVTAALVRVRLDDDLDAVRHGGGPPTGTQLAGMTRDELYRLAREQDLPRRSRMSRDELVAALRG